MIADIFCKAMDIFSCSYLHSRGSVIKSSGMSFKIRSNIKKYDIRGKVSPNFGPQEAYLVGRGFGTLLVNSGQKSVVVGHDVRPSSDKFSSNLIRGLFESGIDIIDCGLCITPTVKFASLLCKSDAAIMITASHNDLTDNGFKFFLNKKPFYGDSLNKLCDIVEQKTFVNGIGSVQNKDFSDLYLENIVKRIKIEDKVKVIWLYQNEFIKSILLKLINLIPGKHRILPNLQNAGEYDVAFDFDTDGDRMVMIDSDGKKIFGDETLALFAINMKKTVSSLKVIFDLKSSRVLIRWLESIGINCETCQVGSCYLDHKLRQSGAELGGEVSGHFMFKDYNSFSDDGIYSACLMLHYLSDFDNMQAMRSLLPEVHLSKVIIIKCHVSSNKFEIMDRIKKHIEGNKVVTGSAVIIQMQEGWIVIRASETEQALTVRCEGFYKDGLQVVQEKADSILSSVGLSIW